jgi:hypothetical protein
MKTKGKYILATVLLLFGLLTVTLTTSVLFDWFGLRAREGNYVMSIVVANLIAGVLYLIAAVGVIKGSTWMAKPLLVAIAVLVLGQILFFVHVVNGGLYETKTVGAMIFRIALTVLFTVLAFQVKRPLIAKT